MIKKLLSDPIIFFQLYLVLASTFNLFRIYIMNFTEPEKSEEENSNKSPELITLLPSGFDSPTLNFSLRHHFFLTQYERQILRA